MSGQNRPSLDSEGERAVISAYRELLASWNQRDAAAYAALFTEDANAVGFDGSPMNGRTEIETSLRQIFADHQTATYVAKVREVRSLAPDVAVLRAVAGMVAPGQSELNPAVNAIQTLVGVKQDGDWRIALFQNTPAAFHGRPDMAESLTAELRQQLAEISCSGSAPPPARSDRG